MLLRGAVGAQDAEDGLDVGEAVVADRLDRGECLAGLLGALLDDVQTDAGLHADGGHGVPEDVVQLAGDAQPFLDREPARPLLAGLGLPGELGAGGREHRPVVADGRAGAARGGRQQHHVGDHADGLGVAEHHPDRDDLDQRGEHGAREAPPPAPVGREGVAADQRGERDQQPGIAADEPDEGDRVEHDQRRDRVAAAHRDRSGDRRDERDRSGVQRGARPRRLRRVEEPDGHAGAEDRVGDQLRRDAPPPPRC